MRMAAAIYRLGCLEEAFALGHPLSPRLDTML